MSKTLTKKDV